MCRARKPLGHGVEKDNQECNRPEETGRPVDRRTGDQEPNRAERKQRPGDRFWQETMSSLGCGFFDPATLLNGLRASRPCSHTCRQKRTMSARWGGRGLHDTPPGKDGQR